MNFVISGVPFEHRKIKICFVSVNPLPQIAIFESVCVVWMSFRFGSYDFDQPRLFLGVGSASSLYSANCHFRSRRTWNKSKWISTQLENIGVVHWEWVREEGSRSLLERTWQTGMWRNSKKGKPKKKAGRCNATKKLESLRREMNFDGEKNPGPPPSPKILELKANGRRETKTKKKSPPRSPAE